MAARLILLLLVLAAAGAAGAERCKVLDPELQRAYTGGCRDGLAEGYGYAAGEGAEYRGEFKAGKKHGKGVKTWHASGDTYEGDFFDDRRHGVGTYTWGPRSPWAGERYRGSFVNDRREGFGTYTWPWGDIYTGTWANDAITGAPTPMMQARARHRKELAAALAQPGARVCREMPIGIAFKEWVRGTVVQAQQDRIAVRIDDPGKHPHVIANVQVRHGDIVWDDLLPWTLCR